MKALLLAAVLLQACVPAADEQELVLVADAIEGAKVVDAFVARAERTQKADPNLKVWKGQAIHRKKGSEQLVLVENLVESDWTAFVLAMGGAKGQLSDEIEIKTDQGLVREGMWPESTKLLRTDGERLYEFDGIDAGALQALLKRIETDSTKTEVLRLRKAANGGAMIHATIRRANYARVDDTKYDIFILSREQPEADWAVERIDR